MKYANIQPIISQSSAASKTSAAFDASQWYSFSATIVAGAGTSTGTVQLQVSDDPIPVGYNLTNNPPTLNWANLGTASTISAAGVTLVAAATSAYRSMRVVWVSTDGSATGSITVNIMALCI